jgi:5-methylthioadenosine/S-adenosylhomocysteine deaminase
MALEQGCALSVHAAESAAEADLLRHGTGPFAAHLRERGIPWRPPGCSAVRYLDGLGVLRTRPLLAHAVTCTAADLELLARAGASIAHCPKSNAKLGHGVAPLDEMLAAGVTVGLGSDGVVSNNTVDLFEEARTALLLGRGRRGGGAPGGLDLDAREALRWMTAGGAEALAQEGIGSIAEGNHADLTAISLSAPHLQPVHDIEAAVVWSASARDVILTMVGGEVLFQDGRVGPFDEAALLREIRALPRRLAALQGG